MPRLAAAGALALLLGWAAAHGLSLQWWTLVPWGLAAVALGYRANRATAVVAGALYGFVLCFVFTLATYGGAAPAITRVPFFTVLVSSVPCAVCCLHYSGRSSCPGNACQGNHRPGMMPPNKRLKLSGGERCKGNGALCPGGHGLSSHTLAPVSGSPAA